MAQPTDYQNGHSCRACGFTCVDRIYPLDRQRAQHRQAPRPVTAASRRPVTRGLEQADLGGRINRSTAPR